MKVEFLIDISDSGKFAVIETHQLVRLFDFDAQQAEKFSRQFSRQSLKKMNYFTYLILTLLKALIAI